MAELLNLYMPGADEESLMLSSMYLFLYSQLILTPILGLIWIGIRRERLERDRQMRELLKALQIIAVSRGKR